MNSNALTDGLGLSAVEGLHERLAGALQILADQLIDTVQDTLRRLP
jgi:hypothetical protein